HSVTNQTAAQIANGTNAGSFTEPGYKWAGEIADVDRDAVANVPMFTVNATVRPITAAAHELGHALSLPHMNIAAATGCQTSAGEDWISDLMGRLQGTKYDHRILSWEPLPDGATSRSSV